jgi:hypothetical protein
MFPISRSTLIAEERALRLIDLIEALASARKAR